jgi:DNA primase
MPLIAEHILDEIQSRADIAEVIGRAVPLQRAGRHFKALCPFHKERTPSFHVNTDKQIFHCFGCGVGGNVFSFLMHQERLTFPEAARRLAGEFGVPMPDERPGDDQTDQLLAVLEKSCRYYERLLANPTQGRAGREYLQRRGVDERSRHAFRLGYAPPAWDQLVKASQRSGSTELLGKAGMMVQGSRGIIDRFRNRLMFPIQDARGRVIGFGGRAMGDQEPKYLNSPETPVYHKGRQLYGLAQAKDAIIEAKAAVLVEGYFDCVLLWQAGIRNVVSPSGTALTPDQARMLTRYAERIILAFDPDAAGEAASVRGMEVLLEAGLQVHVAQLPAGVDPDEVVAQQGADAFRRMLDESLPVMTFLVAVARKRYPAHQPEGRVRAAQSILGTISKVPNAILRAEYVRLLAAAFQLDERAINLELQRVQQPRRGAAGAPVVSKPANGTRRVRDSAERLFVSLVLDQPARWQPGGPTDVAEHIQDAGLRRVLSVIEQVRVADGGPPTPAQVVSRLQDEGMGALVSELVETAQDGASTDQALMDCVHRIRASARKRQLTALQERLHTAQQAGDRAEMVRLLAACQQLMKGMTGSSALAESEGHVSHGL